MSGERRGSTEAARSEAARRAVRALAFAHRTLQWYPLHHAATTGALEAARAALDAFASRYGSLAIRPASGGLFFDAAASPYEDDVVVELARALRARALPAVRLLPGASAAELGQFLTVLHLPRAALEQAGGAAKALTDRGLRTIVVGAGAPPAAEAGGAGMETLLAAVEAGSIEQVGAWLDQARADGDEIREALRAVDRRLLPRPRASQAAVWRLVGRALASLRGPSQAALCAAVVRSLDEPWAASIAAQWPPVLAASLAAPDPRGDAQLRGRRVAEVVRAIHRPPQRDPLPPTDPPDRAALSAAAAAMRWDGRRLRAHAIRRLGALLAVMDPTAASEALTQLEEAVIEMAREGDGQGLLAALASLGAAWGGMEEAGREGLRAAAQRVVTLGGRALLEAASRAPGPLRTPESIEALRRAVAETRGPLRDELLAALAQAGEGGR